MTTPDVRDWFDSEGDGYEWKSDDKAIVRSNLKRISDSGTYPNRTRHFWQRDTEIEGYIDDSTKLTGWIERDNRAYLETRIDDIESAKTMGEVQDVDIDDTYSDDTISQLEALKGEKVVEIGAIKIEKDTFSKESKSRIADVTTIDEFRRVSAELFERAEELDVKNPRKMFGRALDEKGDELLEEEEEETREAEEIAERERKEAEAAEKEVEREREEDKALKEDLEREE